MTKSEYIAQVLFGCAMETQRQAYKMPDEGEDFQTLLSVTKTLFNVSEELRRQGAQQAAPSIGFLGSPGPYTGPSGGVKEKVKVVA